MGEVGGNGATNGRGFTNPLPASAELAGPLALNDLPPASSIDTATDPIDFAGLALRDTTEYELPEHLDNDFDYRVSRYHPNPRDPREPGYFRVDIAARQSLSKLETTPKDVIFLLDTSSSVPGKWVDAATLGVQQALPSLNRDDRFNIVTFNENPRALSTRGPVPATPENLAAASRFLRGASSEGFTDVNAALRQLLVRDVARDRVYELILISDGRPTRGVMDTRDLINLITRDNALAASIYCVGIGDPRLQNRELLDFLAYRNAGFSIYTNDPEDATTAVRNLLSRLRYPLIKQVRLTVAGAAVSDVYPRDLPNVHQGETFSVYGRYDRLGEFTIQITGRSAGKPVDLTFSRSLVNAVPGRSDIADRWAFWKLHHLYSEIIRLGQRPELMQEIERLRREYDLTTLY